VTTTAETAATARATRSARPGRHEAEILARLRKANGQLAGVTAMYEDGRYCIGVLDQLSAVAAATDAVALLILTDHIHTCVADALEAGRPDEKVDELVTAVRRYVRSR
jgi:CsoR family transcriptional regulator, copper-sensing transcriptional repressor